VSNRVLNVSEARRELPRLVQRLAKGGGAVSIGPRGEETAVLVGIEEYRALQARAKGTPPSGWGDLRVEIVGDAAEIEQEIQAIRADFTGSLGHRARRLQGHSVRRKRA
jgi:prevent-host-death family protein